MSKAGKITVLLFTLCIPVAIFVFLKLFGENRFDVMVYYENGVDTVAVGCDFNQKPHTIPYFSMVDLQGRAQTNDLLTDKLTIATFLDLPLDKGYLKSLFYQYDKIREVLSEKEKFNILTFAPGPLDKGDRGLLNYNELEEDNSYILLGKADQLVDLGKCGFVLNTATNAFQGRLVLIGPNKRIRGYYDVNDSEEIDRLILEMKILFENKDEFSNQR